MFTGIVEGLGKIVGIEKNGTNIHWEIDYPKSWEITVGQSISHEGVCLTITNINEHSYFVTLVNETLEKTNLGNKKVGDLLNLERAMPANGRFEGHIVQGHVDETVVCEYVTVLNGSWRYRFPLTTKNKSLVVSKGSIAINGVSLTVAHLSDSFFEVEIIPHTYNQTSFKGLKKDDSVNLEYDIMGKYALRLAGFEF